MSQLNVYFRALTDYRKSTKENRECVKQRKSIARAAAESDRIEIVRTLCEIEEDWIAAIEKGLIPIQKAIGEERQFIRSNGEVVPIEKVKNVSKESVEHLAKHSNLLTKEREGANVIPDKLYTVERLSDFAVYENRFLYMLLCYLRDFISFRYDKILELTNTYCGNLHMVKTIDTSSRKTEYEVRLKEELKNDPYLKEHNPAKSKIERIDAILKTVVMLLSMPLMEFVAKSPMLKPPITETNVLKMNKNFKGAMELYYFINSYTKAGYTIERKTQIINPFSEEIADEFAEIVALSSFLTYEHGMGIESDLKEAYDEQLRQEKLAAQKKHLEQIAYLKKRIRDAGVGPEEYMLLLEQRNRALESDSVQLVAAKAEIEKLNGKVGELERSVEELTVTADSLRQEIEDLNEAHRCEIERLCEEHRLEIERLNVEFCEKIETLGEEYRLNLEKLCEEHRNEIECLQTEHEEKMQALREEYAENTEQLCRAHEQCVQELNEKMAQERAEAEKRSEDMRADYESRLCAAEEEKSAQRQARQELTASLERAHQEKILSDARLNVLKKECGRFGETDDFTSQEGFGEIERQFRIFKNFYNEEWKKTKKKIRKETLRKPDDKNESGDKV